MDAALERRRTAHAVPLEKRLRGDLAHPAITLRLGGGPRVPPVIRSSLHVELTPCVHSRDSMLGPLMVVMFGPPVSRRSTPNTKAPRRKRGIGLGGEDRGPMEWPIPISIRRSNQAPGKRPVASHFSRARPFFPPTVVGERVLVTTAEEDREVQAVLCFGPDSGKQLWHRTDVHQGKMDRKGNKKSSQASSTLACDGERLFVNFLNGGTVCTTALDLNGKILWQTKVSDFATHQGFGSSPALWGELVYVATDSKGGGVVAALDRQSGKILWKRRPAQAAQLRFADRAERRRPGPIAGLGLRSGFEFRATRRRTETLGSSTARRPNASPRWSPTAIACSSAAAIPANNPGDARRRHGQDRLGKPRPGLCAVDGRPRRLSLRHPGRRHGGLLEERNRQRDVEGADRRHVQRFAGAGRRHLFAVSESGKPRRSSARPNPKKFERVGKNRLGDEAFATPAICGGQIYHARRGEQGEQRQEVLYCLGK